MSTALKQANKTTKPAAAGKAAPAPVVDPIDSENVAPEPTVASAPQPVRKVEEMYQKLTQLEHILLRPDTYIGSIEPKTEQMWVYSSGHMAYRNITFVPGLFKIFDEILVNAADNKQRDATMDTLKVTINKDTGTVSVENNGQGIPVEMHAEHGVYVPELIFGHLLTSSNYDDGAKKVTGGRNGYGAKLTNIFSKEFIVETSDKRRTGLKFRQVFSENMSKKSEPKISAATTDFTRITFTPDFAKFGLQGFDDDMVDLMTKRVYDMAGCNAGVKVFFNEQRVPVKHFESFVQLFMTVPTTEAPAPEGEGAAAVAAAAALVGPSAYVFEKIGDRWEIAAAVSDGAFNHVSFVNSICTSRGGTHVDYVANQFVSKLQAHIEKKCKLQVKPAQVRNHLRIFIRCLVENPAFDSQTKETLTTKSSAFGSKCEIDDECIKKLIKKTTIIDAITLQARTKQDKDLSKTDGKKKGRLTGIPKLEDANEAGTKNGHKCSLILTEGDSAKALAVSGLSVIGRDFYGVFPLRGKLANPREANHDSIMKNEEIKSLKMILGLQQGKVYTDTTTLRYGHIMIMTDQDPDGSHIKGLLINLLHAYWPSLLTIPGFLVEFVTPIVKTVKAKQSNVFFTLQEYGKWYESHEQGKGWTVKYYKGLGTSSSAEAKEYFSDLPRHKLDFKWEGEQDGDLIDLVFSKKRADDRKRWLENYDEKVFVDHSQAFLTYNEFVNKELIHFSMSDNRRSIPNMMDGFKPGQRKILFACFKRNLKGEIKVAQLSGYVAEHSAYHHGEASLAGTIIGMAQNYVGSNNVNVLVPSGQFGTRLQGGKDAASPRYIFTNLNPITRLLFRQDDDKLLAYINEDGQRIEPEYYLPIVPTVLINGAEGIGTGWSTSIPCYNPLDIVQNIRRIMNEEVALPMVPWFRGFKGWVEPNSIKGFRVTGIAVKRDETTLDIVELPVGTWTQAYKESVLEPMMEGIEGKPESKPFIKGYKEYHTDTSVWFQVTMSPESMAEAEAEGIERKFKLFTTISTSNMIVFDQDCKMKKYANPEDLLTDFYPVRLQAYIKRKAMMEAALQKELLVLDNKTRFIEAVIKGTVVVNNRKKKDIEKDLQTKGFAAISKDFLKDKEADEQDKEAEAAAEPATGYDYLLNMPIYSLTQEKVVALTAERDKKAQELETLKAKTEKDLWNADLDDFVAGYQKYLAELETSEARDSHTAPGAGGKAKKAAPKGKKGMDSDDSCDEDDDEEFSLGGKKKAAKKPAAKGGAKEASKFPSYPVIPTEPPKWVEKEVKAPKVPKVAKVKAEGADDEVMDIQDDSELSLKERLAKLSIAMAADDEPMVAASKPAAKKAAKPKAKPADDGDFDIMDIDDAPKKAAPKPKAAKEGGAAVTKAAPKKAPAKAKAKEESPVAVREKPARARKPVTYKVGDSDDDMEEDDDSFHADDSDEDFE
jgi:DNA topoisomerase II